MKKTLLALAVGAAMSTSAVASQIAINNGTDVYGDGSTQTTAFDSINFNAGLATSIYLGPIAPGTQVIDTNMSSVLSSFGFAPGTYNTFANTPKTFVNPTWPNSLNIDTLATPVDDNGFTSGNSAGSKYGMAAPGGGNYWGLTYDYVLYGTVTTSDVTYNGGYFDLFYQSANNNTTGRTQVGRLNVTGSAFSGVSLTVNGNFSFDFNNNGIVDANESTSFVKDFWQNMDPYGPNLYDTWFNNTSGNPSAVSFSLNTAVTPPLPAANQLVQINENGPLFRQSTLDGNVSFNVPEPGSLALAGLGLLGLGLARRRKQAA